MDATRFGNWLQVAANIGIIGGLILVAYQINQTSSITRDLVYFERWNAWFDTDMAVMGEETAAAIARAQLQPAELTPEELTVLAFYYDTRIDYWRRVKYLGERGIIYKDDWRAAVDQNHPEYGTGLINDLSTPGGRAHWERRRRSTTDSEFVSALDRALEERDVDTDQGWYTQYQERIKELAEG